MNASSGGNTRSTWVRARACDPLGESLTQASIVELGPLYMPSTSEVKDGGSATGSESEQMSISIASEVVLCF